MAALSLQQDFPADNLLARATLALVAHQRPVEIHQHFAVQVVMSLQHPFQAIIAQQPQAHIQGFVIDAHIAHACQPGDASVLVISVDAATDMAKTLREHLGGQPYALLEDLLDKEQIHTLQRSYWAATQDAQLPYDPLQVIAALRFASPRVPPTDERVVQAMHYIEAHLRRPVRLADIAMAVALSEGRLRHLFVAETGIPLTTYILWSRMKVALHGFVRDHLSLAEAAALAGYADHAHFTRTFKRMFGVSPSALREHSEFIYVFDHP